MPERRHDISVPGGSVSVLASETMQGVPVMMLHGLTSNGAMWIDGGWTALFDRADRSWLALDLRGHGQSLKPKDPAAYRPELHANDFAAVMDALGIPRVDLIGYSLGAHLAGEFAAAHPDRVRGLVIGGFDGGYTPPPAGLAERFRSHLHEGTPLPSREAERVFASILSRPDNDPDAVISCFQAGAESMRPRQKQPVLCGYGGPLLVCAGEQDHLARNIEVLATMTQQGIARWVGPFDHPSARNSPVFQEAVITFLGQLPKTEDEQ
jgi:pimeloyl-ACP methyl ester carboxylesterase